MEGQMSLSDYQIIVSDNGYKTFHEHCKHRGWLKRDEETETAYWMCDYANRQPAQCWADWIKCTECNCPLLKG